MKRAIIGIFAAVLVAFVIWGSGITAADQTFEDRFLNNEAVVRNGESGNYNFDKAHTFVSFKVKHNGLIYVPGFFRDFVGVVNYDAKDITKSSVVFSAKTASIDTGHAGRDTHLKSKDFFEVETYPEITFKSTKVEKKGNDMSVTGDFTMKGVTKSITIPFTLPGFLPENQRTGPRMGIMGQTVLNRRDYNINWGGNIPGTSTPVVADNVDIVLQIESVQPKAPAPAATPTPAE